jgi:hypothetical protein
MAAAIEQLIAAARKAEDLELQALAENASAEYAEIPTLEKLEDRILKTAGFIDVCITPELKAAMSISGWIDVLREQMGLKK